MKVDVDKILAARDVVAERWKNSTERAEGNYIDPDGSVCAYGAWLVASGFEYNDLNFDSKWDQAVIEAEKIIEPVAPEHNYCGNPMVVGWNDDVDRDKEDVVALWDEAARYWKENNEN